MSSLIKFFKKVFRSQLLKCVSPPLVGAVLALCFGSQVYAANNWEILPGGGSTVTSSFIMWPDSIDVIDSKGTYTIQYNASTGLGVLRDPTSTTKLVCHYNQDQLFVVRNMQLINNAYYNLQMEFGVSSDSYGPSFATVQAGNGESKDISYYASSNGVRSFHFEFYGVPVSVYDAFEVILHFSGTNVITINPDQLNASGLANLFEKTVNYTISIYDNSTVTFQSDSSVVAGVDSIDKGLAEQTQQDKSFHDQDRTDATQAGSDMASLGTQLESVKNKWEILWYPIEFTNKVFSAFQGTSTATYMSYYGDITGYTYNDTLGVLEPVISTARAVPRDVSGTNITFPSFTLPVLGVKVWDDYTFDLSTVKDSFPVLFDAIYVLVSIMEVWWFVGFLRDKYEEVFG